MSPDEALQKILDRQYGVAKYGQARGCGLSPAQIRHRVRTGRLVRKHHAVYVAPSAPDTLQQRALAAVLACGEPSDASHSLAAALFGLIDRCTPPDVTVPRRRGPEIPGIHVHRVDLRRDERTRLGVIAVTSVGRTLVDIAAGLDDATLADAVDRAIRKRLISAEQLRRFVRQGRFDRTKRIARLRAIVGDRTELGVPESPLESAAIRLLRRFRLPEPVRQHPATVRGRRVRFDLAYPDKFVAIELDGMAPHTELPTWQRDHHRHNATELGEWNVLRFTFWDVTEDPVYVVTTVAFALGLAPRGWRDVAQPAGKAQARRKKRQRAG